MAYENGKKEFSKYGVPAILASTIGFTIYAVSEKAPLIIAMAAGIGATYALKRW